MPGYVIHLATLTERERTNRNFVKGVLAPDLLKKWYKIFKGDLAQVEAKYAEWEKDGNLPPFSAFEERLSQKEVLNDSFGMHYGMSSSPNLNAFFSDPNVDLKNPFWKGYLKHLTGDFILYQALDIETKLRKVYHSNAPYADEIAKLHKDWDILNKLYIDQYNISLPDEVAELNAVGFETGELVYVDKTIVDNIIYMLNQIHLD